MGFERQRAVEPENANWLHRGSGGGGQILLATCYKAGYGTVTAEVDKIYAMKLKVRKAVTINKLTGYLVNAAGAGGLAVHAIYRDVGSGVQFPSTLITESFTASMDTTAAGPVEIASTVALTLQPGDYWFVWKFGVAAPDMGGQNAYLLSDLEQLIGIKSNYDVAACIKMSETFQKTISGATKANPGVITATAHGFSNGDRVLIHSVVGMTELNGNVYTVTNKAANTFELYDASGNKVDTSGFTTYDSGGKAIRMPATFPTATGNDYSSDYLMGFARPTA